MTDRVPPPAPTSGPHLLFGDAPLSVWSAADLLAEPWASFAAADDAILEGNPAEAVSQLAAVAVTPGLEPRHYLQAWHYLRLLGKSPEGAAADAVLGVVAEVGLPDGTDVLAVYADGSQRYLNHAGGGIVWERPDTSLDELTEQVLGAAAGLATALEYWNEERPTEPPVSGDARLSLLSPGGLKSAAGLQEGLTADPSAGPVLAAMTGVLSALIARAKT